MDKMYKSKFVAKCIFLICICILAGGILVAVANYLPINGNNKAASLEEISTEGSFPEVPSMQGGYGSFQSMKPTALELATDSLMLKMALYEGEDEGIVQAFRCYSTQYEEEYSRYWHGYVIILRILLLFFDYYEIRILNCIFQYLIFTLTAIMVWRQKGVKHALALASSYLLLMPMALGMCLQYSWIFYVSFMALLLYLSKRSFWEKGSRYIYFFILVGAATIYLDLLTYPLLTWGLVIVWWILMQDDKETPVAYLKKVVFSGIAWIVGYGGMWIGKWCLGSIVLRENLFTKAISEALLWTVNEGDSAITLKDRLDTIFLNWSTYDYKIYLIVLMAWLLYWMIRGIFRKSNKNAKSPALLLIACSSIVWYLVLAGHATMHHIFTHRIFGVSIAAFLGMILVSTQDNVKRSGEKKYIIKYVAAMAVITVFSVFSMLLLRDDFTRHNGIDEFAQYELVAPATMSFTPEYAEVTSINVGVSNVGGAEGYCLIQLIDQENVLDQVEIPIEDFKESNFQNVSVEWNLKAGHQYTLSIEPVENNGTVYLWASTNGKFSLPEYGEVLIGNEKVQGQMLASISYWCILTDNSQRLLFTGTYIGIYMMILYSCWSLMGRKRKDVLNQNA